MNETIYKKSFELFLRRTDEKLVIQKFIHKNIPINKEMDFLDIGGGNGWLTSEISKKTRTAFVIEPNKSFYRRLLKQKKTKILNKKWEDVSLDNYFDFILAAYVVTYFPKAKRRYLVKKMYRFLRPGGRILILSIDAKKGSWRKIHTYFYKLRGYNHKSSDDTLKEITREYKTSSKSFKTHVTAKDTDEMLEILKFDFYKYPRDFKKFSRELKRFLNRYLNKSGKVTLEMVHNAYIITKSIKENG